MARRSRSRAAGCGVQEALPLLVALAPRPTAAAGAHRRSEGTPEASQAKPAPRQVSAARAEDDQPDPRADIGYSGPTAEQRQRTQRAARPPRVSIAVWRALTREVQR